jgi:quaternary ammonium compound-resistance protein SugE
VWDIASVFEVVFALGTNGSQGFTRLGWSAVTILAAAGGIFFLSLALKTQDRRGVCGDNVG